MYHYTIIQWMFFFYLYCFLGWCFESAYVSICQRRLTNRGFLRGPFLPIYGSGATMMLVVSSPFQDNILLTYLAGCVGATVLEYVVGVTMEALFKVRYWDYTRKRFNYKGQICLSSTLTWGGFTILMTEVIHVPIERFGMLIPYKALVGITFAVTVLFFVDFALSFKAAIDLRDILAKMTQAREELSRIQKRLDVLIAVTGEYAEGVKEEIGELRTKFAVVSELRRRLGAIRDFFQRDMIMSNDMTSIEYQDSLEELKSRVNEDFDDSEL